MLLHWSPELQLFPLEKFPKIPNAEGENQVHRAALSQRTDMVPPFENPEVALRQVNELSFYTATEETRGDIPEPSWKAVLNDEADP